MAEQGCMAIAVFLFSPGKAIVYFLFMQHRCINKMNKYTVLRNAG